METRTVLRCGVVLIGNGAIVEPATSAAGLLRRSGARSILLASCRAN